MPFLQARVSILAPELGAVSHGSAFVVLVRFHQGWRLPGSGCAEDVNITWAAQLHLTVVCSPCVEELLLPVQKPQRGTLAVMENTNFRCNFVFKSIFLVLL